MPWPETDVCTSAGAATAALRRKREREREKGGMVGDEHTSIYLYL